MNLKNKIFGSLIIFVLISGSAAAQDCKSKVEIKTDLDNSLIYINNKLAGKGVVSTELEKGIYDITVTASGKEWEAEMFNDSLSIDNCRKDTTLLYSFRKQTYLNSEPQDAEVFSGDSLIGYTPLFISSEISPLVLRKTDYQTKKISQSDFADGRIVKLIFTGSPRCKGGRQEGKSFYERPVFKYLIGGILVLGAATAYFKIKADNAFSDYQQTQNQTSLDSTHRYDLVSGIAFGALQINLGILIYHFLTE